ncbi:MAG: hypothetical protein GY710_25075 [Desulfobacteraceae bacterium]|nr:hypothetical protein [Desulfobacteraceae bacterium]
MDQIKGGGRKYSANPARTKLLPVEIKNKAVLKKTIIFISQIRGLGTGNSPRLPGNQYLGGSADQAD